MEPLGRRKRALDEGDERRDVASESDSVSPRLVDARRVTGAVKSRRLNEDLRPPNAAFGGKLRPGTASFSSGEASGRPSATGAPFANPFETKKAPPSVPRPIFTLPGQSQGHTGISAPLGAPGRALLDLEQKTSPSSQLRRLDGSISVMAGGISPIRAQEQKTSPLLQARMVKPVSLKATADAHDHGLPGISHFLGGAGQEANKNPGFGSLNTPYRASAATTTTTPSSKQATTREPFPFPRRRTIDTTKEVSTPVMDSGGVSDTVGTTALMSFGDYLSSDEELLGIPGPEIPDPDISFSQEKLGDLSVTENSLEETVVLTLCEGLANSLTKAERERLELLNLYTISLTQQPSPIMLGRDQFQDVFGDSIRGGMISHLSRRHCLIHVESVQSRNDSAKRIFKVKVEDTSTNGIKVNGLQLKNGQVLELELDDVITLLKIRHDEDDVSLEYKLIRADPLPRTKRRKSRHDGRFVRPSDRFSLELADLSNRHGLSPMVESDVTPPSTVSAIACETRHQIPSLSACGEIQSAESREEGNVGTSNPEPIQRICSGVRSVRCTILFADQFALDFSDSSQPFEEANLDYREELSEIFSPFASITTFDASSYQCATAESITEALKSDSDVLLYTGGGDEDHLVVESPDGFSVRLEKDKILQILSEVKPDKEKLLVVISPSPGVATMLAAVGRVHVCFLSSGSKHSLRATAFLRALFAGLLKGYPIKKTYMLAEYVALNDLLPIVRPEDQICKMLPASSRGDSVKIGSTPTGPVVLDRNSIALINAPFIPVLTTHFLGRDAVVREAKEALATKLRVCSIYGARGVGKSSIAIHIAKASHRGREYQNGVHFFAVDKLVEHIQNGLMPVISNSQDQDCPRSIQREEVMQKMVEGVEALLHSLPELHEKDDAKYPTTLLVFDGCDVILPTFRLFVESIARRFSEVQILLTSTDKITFSADNAGNSLPHDTVHVTELSKMDSAKLFFKLARGHLTSNQFRQHFPGGNIEAISNDERLLSTKGNPFRISRLVYELESQLASKTT